jgi:hypothetical protein
MMQRFYKLEPYRQKYFVFCCHKVWSWRVLVITTMQSGIEIRRRRPMTTSSFNKKTSVSTSTNLHRDLILTILAGQAFVAAPYVSQGWFLVVVTYILLVTALFHCIKTHNQKPIANWVFWCVNLLGCSGLTAALLFSGRGVV